MCSGIDNTPAISFYPPINRADFTWQKAQCKGPVTTTHCHPYLPRVSHVSPQIPKVAIRGSYEAALRKGVT